MMTTHLLDFICEVFFASVLLVALTLVFGVDVSLIAFLIQDPYRVVLSVVLLFLKHLT